MIKIKEFMGYAEGFETFTNNWLIENQNIEIVDIKYSTYLEKDGNYYSCCIVMYKEEGNKKDENNLLTEIISFFQKEGESWDKDSTKKEFAYKIKELSEHELDEIDLIWGEESLMTLDDFVDQYFENVLESICNVLKSFKTREEK